MRLAARRPSAAIIAAVQPPALVVAGFITLAAGVLILLSFGPRFRVGRLLAATPEVSVADALAEADVPAPRYLRVAGRIDSEAEFEDTAHRPLVYRRTRIQLRRRGGWVTVDEGVEVVPFELAQDLEAIGIDGPALGDGLVVIPREAPGRAADVADRVPDGTAPGTPARAVIEQVSSVEHAIVVGVPTRGPDGSVAMSAGNGRPLILTTLESDEAMRILTGGDRRRPFLAAVLLGAGLILVVVGLVLGLAESVL